MNIELQSNKENEHINLFNVIKAEGRKVIDTQVAKVILGVTFFLTVAMFIVSLILLKNQTTWIDSYSMISGPATTMLGIIFILHVCEEWTKGTAFTTYTFVPKRNRVLLSKFIVLLSWYLVTLILLLTFSVISMLIGEKMYAYGISWETSLSSVVVAVLPLLINMLFAFALSVAIQETTVVLVLFFIIPPITVLLAQIPNIGLYFKWISLEHSSSIFIAGASGTNTSQYISSIIFWIVIPSVIGIIRNNKRDVN